MTMPRLLFVCLGNICRSPLAQGAFQAAAERHGLVAEADSAGTAAYHVGEPPDPRAIRIAARNGVDISHYRGRQIERSDFGDFTHIFAMDHTNLRNIEAIAPQDAPAHVAMLMDAVHGRTGQAVADPYYGDDSAFEVTWADVDAAAKALVAALVSERA